MKNLLIGLLAFGVISWGVRAWEVNELKQPTERPVAQATAPVNTSTNDSEWTNAKQVFYNACMLEANDMEWEYFCSCSADYMMDTYGVEQVASWGNADYIPDHVINQMLERCL